PTALGQRGEDCWQEIWATIHPFLQQVKRGEEAIWQEDLLIPIFRNGSIEDVYWTFSYSAVMDEDAKVMGVLVICNETTNSVLAYQEIEKTKDDLEFAIEATELATWDLNPFTNKLAGNDRMKNWFGVTGNDEMNLSTITNAVAEADRARVIAAIQHALSFDSGGIYNVEYAIVNPKDLKPRYVKTKGKALFNGNRIPIRFSGTMEDITAEKMAIEELRLSKERLEQAYEQVRLSKQAAQLGMFDLDLKHGTMQWDERCRELFGISHTKEVTYEKDFLPGLHPEDRERISKLIDNLFIREISNGNYDVEYKTVGTEDGKIRWVRAKGKVFFDEANKPVRFIGSVFDISDLKKDEERKNAFIGMVSHELKTPLTTVKAYIQMMMQRADGEKNDFETRALEKTEVQLTKMSAMIDGFLNLSRLESGKIHLNIERFNIKELIEEIIAETTITVTTHVITLHLCDSVQVSADRTKIGNVISNLLSNAVKYSTKGKPVDIKCEQIENMAQISIRDEGIGITPQDKEKLFSRFYRVQNNNTKQISGFGIGLYLSAEIVERHGGKIWVESKEGIGSTFYFALPVA
ncbi:MAG: ATP-binding protein, partial [Bacteroidota bacterium]|nr:ATP-binding protein [Bacteroidota bacterium]